MRAAARRFENVCSRIATGGHQVTPRPGSSGQAQIGRLVIARLEVAADKVAQQFRPGIFGITDNDRIRMRLGVVGCERYVRSAHDNLDATLSKTRRNLVGALRRSGNNGNTDEVNVDIQRDILDAFVIQGELVFDLVRNQCRQRRQCQRRIPQGLAEDTAAMTVKGSFRRQQCNPDHPPYLILRVFTGIVYQQVVTRFPDGSLMQR